MSTSTANRSKPRVLIVEDNELLLSLFSEAISDIGIDVERAVTAEEGLDTFQQGSHIALLLTDVRTPGPMSGWDLARAIYMISPNIPVIIMSGYAYESAIKLLPNTTLINKPFPLDALCDLVLKRIGAD